MKRSFGKEGGKDVAYIIFVTRRHKNITRDTTGIRFGNQVV